MKLVRVEDSFVNPYAIEAIFPDSGETVHGFEMRRPDPNRCRVLLGSGQTVDVGMPAGDLAELLREATRPRAVRIDAEPSLAVEVASQ